MILAEIKCEQIDTKLCSTCREFLAVSSFSRNRCQKDGLSNVCKKCMNNVMKHHNSNRKNRIKKTVYVKKCNLCNQEKLASLFNMDIKSPDNLQYNCKECASIKHKEWRKNNPSKVNAKAAFERALRKQSAPLWLTDVHKTEIEFLYDFAASIKGLHGKEYDVDHIHPINGDGFNGLHVPWNMQVISASENRSKGNKIPSEEFDIFWKDK